MKNEKTQEKTTKKHEKKGGSPTKKHEKKGGSNTQDRLIVKKLNKEIHRKKHKTHVEKKQNLAVPSTASATQVGWAALLRPTYGLITGTTLIFTII